MPTRRSLRPLPMLVLAALTAADAPATRPTTGPAAAALDWHDANKDAAKLAGQTITVTGPVMGTHVTGKTVILNLGHDFPDDDRFRIAMPFDPAAGAADEQFEGMTATVTGRVRLYKKKVGQIDVADAKAVKLTK